MNWQTGFWRLVLVVWILGSCLITVGRVSDSRYLRDPFLRDHPDHSRPCFEGSREITRTLERVGAFTCGSWIANLAEYEQAHAQWESEKRFQMLLPGFWRDLGWLLVGVAGWGIGVWGIFYVAKWIIGSFLGVPKSRAPPEKKGDV